MILIVQIVDGKLFFGPFQRAGQSILVGSIASHGSRHRKSACIAESVQHSFACRFD